MEKSNEVNARTDYFYLKSEKDYNIFYKNIRDILMKEFKFDKLSEKGPTKYEPIKSKLGVKISAVKDKDVRTALEVTVKFSYKKPNQPFLESKETSLVNLTYSGKVITKYKQDTEHQRWIFQQMLRNFLEKNFFKKERGKYQKECEELMEAIRRRVRELYEELPSIHRK